MSDDIKPALTAEEWADPDHSVKREDTGEWAYTPPAIDGVVVGVGDSGVCVGRAIRHAVAALCLHGQPFGFTREMADAVLAAAGLHADVAKWIGAGWLKAPPGTIEEHADAERELIAVYDRIAALLPPEDANG